MKITNRMRRRNTARLRVFNKFRFFHPIRTHRRHADAARKELPVKRTRPAQHERFRRRIHGEVLKRLKRGRTRNIDNSCAPLHIRQNGIRRIDECRAVERNHALVVISLYIAVIADFADARAVYEKSDGYTALVFFFVCGREIVQ